MSLHGNDVCLLEAEDYNLYEEEASDHAFSRSEKHHIGGGGKTMEAEKRIRREIANSNERRRMQSINAGFQALRTLLPRHEGEKLSKAAILQQTAEYIYSLEQEKTRLLSQNCQLKRLLNQHEGGEIPLKKRKSELLVPIIPDSTEEGASPEPVLAVTTLTAVPVLAGKKEDEVRAQLECERRLRRLLEERLTALEAQLYRDGAASAPATAAPPPPPPAAPAAPYDVKDERKVDVEELELSQLGVGVAAPLLEAVIKAEPRVEVELVEAPPSTSRQNLETIVEAIRHLEGDHLFQEDGGDAPLALTKKPPPPQPPRPGVIVVKHS